MSSTEHVDVGRPRAASLQWLVLFDIDGTLLRSDGAGRVAMEQAGLDLIGRQFVLDGIEFGGKLDRNIWREVCARNGLDDPERWQARFRAVYLERFEALFATGERTVTAMPGTHELLDVLGRRDDVAVGILSGNYPESGARKLVAAGMAPEQFGVGAWGCDADRREDLLPVALERCAARHGWRPSVERVVVLGDTPADVAVARAHGARCLAVLTGWAEREALIAAGPDRLVDDVSDTADIVRWIVGDLS